MKPKNHFVDIQPTPLYSVTRGNGRSISRAKGAALFWFYFSGDGRTGELMNFGKFKISRKKRFAAHDVLAERMAKI